MKKRILIVLLLMLLLAMAYGFSHGGKNDSKGSLQTETQTATDAEPTLTEPAVEKEIPKEETAPIDTTITKPLQEQAAGTNNKTITLSEKEMVSGKVSISQVGGSIDHTFSTEELKGFVDSFNSFNITEADRKKPSETHTASESPITVSLQMNNSKTMVFMAFDGGETYVTDDNDNGYALLDKNLSDYILELSKYLFTTETTINESAPL